jgi:hypothetical protein
VGGRGGGTNSRGDRRREVSKQIERHSVYETLTQRLDYRTPQRVVSLGSV